MADPSLTSPSRTSLRSPDAPLTPLLPLPEGGEPGVGGGEGATTSTGSAQPAANKTHPHLLSYRGEYVPVEGDEVTYKVCRVPPKNLKVQAVEVKIIHLNPGTKHETWSGQVISS